MQVFFTCVLLSDDSDIELTSEGIRQIVVAAENEEPYKIPEGLTLVAHRKQKLSSGEILQLGFSDLSPDSGYDVYIAAEDLSTNLMVC